MSKADVIEIEYIEKPKRLFFAVNRARTASCINILQEPPQDLTGRGILVAVLDSGIDYFHEDFRNPDGTTRIAALWDQTLDRVFTREELEIIAGLAEKYDAYIVTDEVYEHIVYAPHKHTYFAALPGMRQRTISCSSLSKTYSITGWRLGYTIAPPEITDRIKKVHDFLTVGAAAPLQEAVIPGLKFGQDYYDGLLEKYTHKRELFLKGLDDLKLSHTTPEGAYYVLLDVSEFGYDSDLRFCEDLAEKVGVGAVPGSSFFREPVNHLIRFHFAKKDETLLDALNRLEDLRDKIPMKGRRT